MLTGKARLGLRMAGGKAEAPDVAVDIFPVHRADESAGAVCLIRLPEDRDELLRFKELSQDLRTVIESSYDGLWICDSQANVIQINGASERLNGISASEVVGRNMADLVAEGLLDRSITLEVLETQAPVTRVQTTREGRRLLSTGNPVFDEHGRIVMVVTNDRDLSEIDRLRKQILTKTALSQRYHEELIDRQLEGLAQEEILFRSPAMLRVVETALRVARVDSSVLITGPSGVGKERIAELIHRRSARSQRPMIRVNCGAIPESLFESEVFGYERGAFTGAHRQGKPGLVEVADGGVLFLDEVAEIPANSQVKLLRFLDDGTIQRVGSTRGKKVDVRILAATNQSLETLVQENRFRQDLYFRLRVIPIHVPPLAERREDIPILVEHFLGRFSRVLGQEKRISPEAMDLLTAYAFPGNVRELVNLCERLAVMCAGPTVRTDDLPAAVRNADGSPSADPPPPREEDPGGRLKDQMARYERTVLEDAVRMHRTQEEVARFLHVNQATIARKMARYGLRFGAGQ
jgi:PAS domain S-box-containing protein